MAVRLPPSAFRLLLSAFYLLLSACGGATYVPAATLTPPAPTTAPAPATRWATDTPVGRAPQPTLPLPTAGATITPHPTQIIPTPATPCPDQACADQVDHLWLVRPVPSDGEYVNYPDRSYRYGSTQDGQREPHHGVELVNPRGTPILAAAPGTVIVAGNDDQVAYGPTTKFYGNLVVVQLDQASNGLPVYNLYGHMLEVAAKVGDRVDTGDLLGSVGLTGVAIGAHLHFEVRVGQNDYESTRNPELWFIPLPMKNKPQGVVAGRVVDTNDHLVPELTVVLRPLAVKADYVHNFYLTTYANDPYQLNGDAVLQENFAITDVPPGTYSVSVNTTKFYQQTITVKPGQIAWAAFVVKPLPPTETPTVAP